MGVAAARHHNLESRGRIGRSWSSREYYRDDSCQFLLFRGIRGSLFRQHKNDPRIARNTRSTRKVLNSTLEAKVPLTFKTFRVLLLLLIFLAALPTGKASSTFEQYEGRTVVAVEVVFEGSPSDPPAEAEFLSIIRIPPNSEFSAVTVRNALQALFDSERVANARVEAFDVGGGVRGPIRLRFVIQRQIQIGDVRFEITPGVGVAISEDELRARVNLSLPGTRLSRQIVLRNTNELLIYLRDVGYFNAVVESAEQLDPSGTRATVTFRVVPGEQARVRKFDIGITGFDANTVRPTLELQQGARFTREGLGRDVRVIREAIINSGYLAPLLEEARVVRD